MKKTLLTFSAFTLLTFSSCKKDKEPENVTPTVANLSGTYKITLVTIDNTNVFNNSDANLNLYKDCERDDQYKLNSDMSYQIIDAGTVCTDPTNDQGTWSLSNNTISFDGETRTITSFNGKKLVMSETLSGYTIVYTYEK